MTKRKPTSRDNARSSDPAKSKVMVVLHSRDVTALDHCVVDLRARTESNVTRSDIIQALVAGFVNANVDFSKITSLEDLATRLQRKLKG